MLSFLGFLKPVTQVWAALLAWEICEAETRGKGPFVIRLQMNHWCLEPNSIWDSFSYVTLKSGSTLPFPFPLFVPSQPGLPPSTTPFTFCTKTFRIPKFQWLPGEEASGPPTPGPPSSLSSQVPRGKLDSVFPLHNSGSLLLLSFSNPHESGNHHCSEE